MLPDSLKSVSLFFERLPGIGEKTANRLALYLLRLPESDLAEFGKHITELKARTKRCQICMNLTEVETCAFCIDGKRDKSIITVVESPLDILSFERGNIYHGVFHVLHGRIDPLNNMGPDDIYIDSLIQRIKHMITEDKWKKVEIILATSPDMEGDATALYIKKKCAELSVPERFEIIVSRLAYGLPIGASIEYADYGTLGRALENRKAL